MILMGLVMIAFSCKKDDEAGPRYVTAEELTHYYVVTSYGSPEDLIVTDFTNDNGNFMGNIQTRSQQYNFEAYTNQDTVTVLDFVLYQFGRSASGDLLLIYCLIDAFHTNSKLESNADSTMLIGGDLEKNFYYLRPSDNQQIHLHLYYNLGYRLRCQNYVSGQTYDFPITKTVNGNGFVNYDNELLAVAVNGWKSDSNVKLVLISKLADLGTGVIAAFAE